MFKRPDEPQQQIPDLEDFSPDDRVYGWRTRVLVFAGAPLHLAEKIAHDRSIDLHRAERVMKAAGPELAERILL